ncbi:hypothetical protein M8J75_003757 [Diaphorina citri]|nr:hypothetical protein M8J75_003757 [Diaphorina citri]
MVSQTLSRSRNLIGGFLDRQFSRLLTRTLPLEDNNVNIGVSQNRQGRWDPDSSSVPPSWLFYRLVWE